MKKRFAAPLAAMLAMSMTFSSLAAVKLDTPVVRWSSEREAPATHFPPQIPVNG